MAFFISLKKSSYFKRIQSKGFATGIEDEDLFDTDDKSS
jgi:hypothetical protein